MPLWLTSTKEMSNAHNGKRIRINAVFLNYLIVWGMNLPKGFKIDSGLRQKVPLLSFECLKIL